MNFLPAMDRRLAEVREATSNDDICTCIMNYVKNSWPSKGTGSYATEAILDASRRH